VLALVLASLSPQSPPPAPAIEAKVAAITRAVDPAELRRSVETLVGFGTRHIASATDQPGRGTGAARDWLEQRLRDAIAASGGRLAVARETYEVQSTRLGRTLPAVNLVATLRGTTDPERIYVVGGHYDSINSNPRDAERAAPGANDDGSGTAAVLELVRSMAAHEFAATILFVCYDGEEQGLLGSTAHARALREAGASVDGMITNDIVGNTLGVDRQRYTGELRCFSYSARGNDSTSRSLARAATFAARRHLDRFTVRLVYRGDRYGRGGDHRPFFAEGYPSLRFSEPREDWSRQHQDVTERDGKPYGDLPEFVDYDHLADVVRANAALLAELASAPRPPAELRVRGARDRYATALTWPPVDGAAGYEAVWRATTAADWEQARMLEPRAGERGGLTAELDGVLLDDVVVGIRAVGADGARSRATTPPEPDAFEQRPARGR
jgi:hypothetical protein